ncbi:MAG: hypothetical protein ACLQDL_11330 [Spirochaetia bacterium]
MVKPRAHFHVLVVAACALAAGGCALRGPFVKVNTESLLVSHGPAAQFLSLASSAGSLYAIFADRSTTTLDLVTVPEGPHLPSAPPPVEVIDKVDVAPPLSPAFGEHLLSVAGGSAAVLYLDRATDVRNVLKLATRKLGETQWNLDVLEPPGDPLLLAPDEAGGFGVAWSSGSLSYRPAGAQAAASVQPLAFKLEGHARPDGAGGFTAFDSLTSQLLALRWTGSGFSTQVIVGGSPVQASLRSSAGLLSVISWDAQSRRLLLHQEKAPGGAFSSATVTVCDGTETVALLRGRTDATFIVLFDEVRSLGAGRTVSELSLIAPGTLLGGRGTRYRKAILASGDSLIDGFAAARTPDALYLLVSQGDLRLLRIPLTP